VRDLPGWHDALESTIEDEVRNAAYRIIERKGSTNHAIGLVTANLLRGMLQNERRVLTVSRVQEGAAGVEGVALSLPAVVGIGGAVEVIEPDLDETERVALVRSADILAGAAADL
jgi:L-lactate dehydrogenase